MMIWILRRTSTPRRCWLPGPDVHLSPADMRSFASVDRQPAAAFFWTATSDIRTERLSKDVVRTFNKNRIAVSASKFCRKEVHSFSSPAAAITAGCLCSTSDQQPHLKARPDGNFTASSSVRRLRSFSTGAATLAAARSFGTADRQQHPDAKQDSKRAADPYELVGGQLAGLVLEIHAELDHDLLRGSDLSALAKYYFDGKGKALRPVIGLCIAHAYNAHTGLSDPAVLASQRKIAIISEMIHTASLLHDDVLDHAESRRGKPSVNLRWGARRSTFGGDYILAVSSRLLAAIDNPDVVQILSQVLADLVAGELMQLQQKGEEDKEERFQHYLDKSFNKTASLMAYSCKANAVLSSAEAAAVEGAFQYGRHIGIAFQLVDDLLDFTSSAEQLGKPAAADLQLGLATAPVLYAAKSFPELELLIGRRFSEAGDVEKAFHLVLASDGLEETKVLARKHCHLAVESLNFITHSQYKAALVQLCEKVLNRLS